MAIEIQKVAGTAYEVDFRSFVYAASTHPQPDTSFPFGKPTSEKWFAPIAGDDEEEREWSTIVGRPRVRDALRRMAAEARRQYYVGETEEGGFGLE